MPLLYSLTVGSNKQKHSPIRTYTIYKLFVAPLHTWRLNSTSISFEITRIKNSRVLKERSNASPPWSPLLPEVMETPTVRIPDPSNLVKRAIHRSISRRVTSGDDCIGVAGITTRCEAVARVSRGISKDTRRKCDQRRPNPWPSSSLAPRTRAELP